MKKQMIIYWISTSLFAAFMLLTAIPDILSQQEAIEVFNQLKMPAYLLPFLGIAKLFGVIAILVPGYPTVKEWAYAGLFFDIIGAGYCNIASGQPASLWIFISIPITLETISYLLYQRRMLRMINQKK